MLLLTRGGGGKTALNFLGFFLPFTINYVCSTEEMLLTRLDPPIVSFVFVEEAHSCMELNATDRCERAVGS